MQGGYNIVTLVDLLDDAELAPVAAAQCNHCSTSIMASGKQTIENQLQGFPVFERFTIGQDDRQYRKLRKVDYRSGGRHVSTSLD